MSLVSLEVAKTNLRIDGDDSDSEITRKLAQAEAIVADYCGETIADLESEYGDSTGDQDSFVHAAVLLALTELFDNRQGDPLTTAVMNLLRRVRDPVVK